MKQNKAYIYLDFDGVLNIDGREWDKTCINNLNSITNKTGADLIISSSWRLSHDIFSLRDLLKLKGATGLVFGITPDFTCPSSSESLYMHPGRGVEILAHRKFHSIKNCVALDDDDCPYMQDILLRTNFETGLTREIADRAIRKLLNDN